MNTVSSSPSPIVPIPVKKIFFCIREGRKKQTNQKNSAYTPEHLSKFQCKVNGCMYNTHDTARYPSTFTVQLKIFFCVHLTRAVYFLLSTDIIVSLETDPSFYTVGRPEVLQTSPKHFMAIWLYHNSRSVFGNQAV